MCKTKKVIKALLSGGKGRLNWNETVRLGTRTQVNYLKDDKDFRENLSIFPKDLDVPEQETDLQSYQNLTVATLRLHRWAKAEREIARVHKAAAGPVILITSHRRNVLLSGVHFEYWDEFKSDGFLAGPIKIIDLGNTSNDHEFLKSLNIAFFPKSDLRSCYQGWLDRLDALVDSLRYPGFCWDHLQRPDEGHVLQQGASSIVEMIESGPLPQRA